ncbi:MAG: Stk1 family PASTA domain-containing Ser/Thr kinase [Micrococcaceae bacterium]|nr:Stk1 family PASTA domain-containing Ser/Thr kinase [Micrococcaceae bacterium]MDN5878625.1 Stk1 family PASTA domain-containing Ser/Thr kinase [Micrococcaceae bacterium]MDN5886109.1 Stk1 family PASTA domain-containing Ser/Thr kinase [Micrococcaceae bacterium]MDN6168870.1 Stk1 family PASTA domain-containing Ser/Thr kinase [Micrococcaceae bacterium]MDN6300823.1 Stk1 family PASTA domain-containing Ser/Thr kinase [Micrococcaceae bacterium]
MTEPRILNARYEVGDLIGRGGMADVYHARDLRLGREVAIKLLRRDLARDPVFQTRFRREAQAVAGLNHPAIVSVYDTGEEDVDASGDHVTKLPYIVMEYVRGKTLRDLSKAGELNPQSSVRYTLGVLSALEYSHRMGIVHRDIKPSNVMVTGDDAVKVMDFGIARAMSDSSATMTQTQAVVGTAQYFSPEQARGETVDARSDLYSAGCLLYELLTGRPPFTGDSPVSVAFQHVSEKPVAASVHNPEISPRIDEVISTALTKDRDDRYQDAAAFAAALRAAQDDRPVPKDLGDATQALAVMPMSTQAMLTTEPPTQALASGPPGNEGRERTAALAAEGSGGAGDTGKQPAVHATDSQESLLAGSSGPSRTDEADRQRTSRRRAWITVFSILAVIVIALGAWFFWNWSQDQQERNAMIPVPDVSNLSVIDAQNKIYAANLKPVTKEVYDDDVDSGSVVGTDPKAGSSTRKDSEVQLLVSQGPEQVTLPKDLAGQSEATVRSTLERLGLDVSDDVKRENTATVELGSLIGTNPKLGEKVKTGSLIELTLSTGKVTVPSLIGLDVDEARKVLSDNAVGLQLESEEKESSKPVDSVIEQTPVGGKDLDQDGTVRVKIAKKPEPEESPSAPPSESEPGSDSKESKESAKESSKSSKAAEKSSEKAASESAKASKKASKSSKAAEPSP